LVATQTSITVTASVKVAARVDIETGTDRAAIASAVAAPQVLSARFADVHVARDDAAAPPEPEAPRYGSAPVPSVLIQAQLLGQRLAREAAWSQTGAKIAHLAYETTEPDAPAQAATGVFFLDRRKPVDVKI
jgi:hypothetical protein